MDALLFLHILGVIIFFGNIITAAFWKVRADIKGVPQHIHDTVKNVMMADIIFTVPGIVLIVVSGILMIHQTGYPLDEFNWLTLSIFLFILEGIYWLAVLIPIQRKMIRFSAEDTNKSTISSAYQRASVHWTVAGVIATLVPFVILVLMVTKLF